jgi:hypothetical protein
LICLQLDTQLGVGEIAELVSAELDSRGGDDGDGAAELYATEVYSTSAVAGPGETETVQHLKATFADEIHWLHVAVGGDRPDVRLAARFDSPYARGEHWETYQAIQAGFDTQVATPGRAMQMAVIYLASSGCPKLVIRAA